MRILTWLFFATLSLILLLQLRGIESDLRTPDTPYGMTGFELSWSTSRADSTMQAWQRAGVTETAKVSLGVGMVFVLAYPILLAASIALLQGAPRSIPGEAPTASAFATSGRALRRAVLIAIPLGIVENLLLWRMLDVGATPWLAHLATACAIAKFVLALLAGGWFLLALGERLASRFAPSSLQS